ncbi:MAG: DUF1778 domain-containing protein [Bdellovibrionales bacterium]
MQTQTTRSDKIDLRLSVQSKQLLRNAAIASNKSMSEFVLESALARAEETLADRRVFTLDTKQWKRFMDALDAPAHELPRLKRLFQERGVFESE